MRTKNTRVLFTVIRKTARRFGSGNRRFVAKYSVSASYLAVNRRSVSRAVLVGLFIGFIPMPLQMAAIIMLLPYISFNAPLALLLCFVANPVTMPFIYYAEYQVGSWVLMEAPIKELSITLEWFESQFERIVFPLYVGALVCASAVSVPAYYLVRWLWVRSVRRERKERRLRAIGPSK